MSGHELALQKALVARLTADAAVHALVGGRIFDLAPEGAETAHLLIGRGESRPVAADGCGMEHQVTLTAVSRFRGSEEAKAVLAAVRAALEGAHQEGIGLEADGVRTVSLSVRFADVFPASDGRRVFAVMRIRAVTEEV